MRLRSRARTEPGGGVGDANEHYAVQVAGTAEQQLLERPRELRQELIVALRRELTGAFGDQTTAVEAWHLPSEHAYWATLLSGGWLAVYRAMTPAELRARRGEHDDDAERGFLVLYLLLDVDAGGAL